MKKIVLIVFVFFLFVYIGSKKKEKVEYNYEEKKYAYVFLQNKDSELIGVRVRKYALNKDEEIEEVFSYLTKKNSCLPVGYKNYMVLSTELVSFSYDNKELCLCLSNDFFRTKNAYALKQIYFSYYLLGFEKIYLYVENSLIEEICDIEISSGLPSFLANPVYDKYNNVVTIFHVLDNDYIKPVSYFVPDDFSSNEAEFICD